MGSLGRDGFVKLGQPAIICHPLANAHLLNSALSMFHSMVMLNYLPI
jgi:hypothetical protein